MGAVINILTKAHTFLLDILFPKRCISCNSSGSWICDKCLLQMPVRTEHVCFHCEKTLVPGGRTCFSCKKKAPLDALVSAAPYSHDSISHAVHLFKYRFIPDLSEPLAGLLVKTLLAADMPLPDIVMPVPLHKRRLRWRGFNQAELLAKHLAKNLLPADELPMDTLTLKRLRYTAPQMGVKKPSERAANVKNAMAVTNAAIVRNKTILLVDDVATTCATLYECARVLKEAGAHEVFAAVVARQESKRSIH